MSSSRARAAGVIAGTVIALLLPSGASAGVLDTRGREWRQLDETTGLSPNQVASVCPRDGATTCSGTAGGKDMSRWVWATDRQVIELMSEYVPELATADPPVLTGPQWLLQSASFLGVMRQTTFVAIESFSMSWTGGWSASTAADGAPISASTGFQHPVFDANFTVAPYGTADTSESIRGVWLWRDAALDYSAPVVTPVVTGTKGNNGWFTSDVSVSWSVTDAESPIDQLAGCGNSAVNADTTGVTFLCSATSAGGTGNGSVTVKRDATPPVITCQTPAPVFNVGDVASVKGTASDALAGPASAPVSIIAITQTAGSKTATLAAQDLAGNRATKPCPYTVVVPKCRGLTPTIVGTQNSDVINGTPGDDVIQALTGNDTVNAGGGNDVVCGWNHNDSLNGGDGDDVLDGGDGSDSIRGDNGRDSCVSGEQRMSSCEVLL